MISRSEVVMRSSPSSLRKASTDWGKMTASLLPSAFRRGVIHPNSSAGVSPPVSSSRLPFIRLRSSTESTCSSPESSIRSRCMACVKLNSARLLPAGRLRYAKSRSAAARPSALWSAARVNSATGLFPAPAPCTGEQAARVSSPAPKSLRRSCGCHSPPVRVSSR